VAVAGEVLVTVDSLGNSGRPADPQNMNRPQRICPGSEDGRTGLGDLNCRLYTIVYANNTRSLDND
jgi:hypothetical protein